MSPAQVSLLNRLIKADRAWRTQKEAGVVLSMNERGVEIGFINAVSVKTAQSLQDAGLIEIVNIYGRASYAFLGSYHPFD